MSIGAVRTDPDVNAPPPSAATDAVRQSLQSWQPGTPSSDSGDAKAKSRDSREAREPREREPREQSKPRRVTTTYSAALGVPPRPVFVYREPPRPRQTAAYYAPAPRPRQASSRAWTAHFFDRF